MYQGSLVFSQVMVYLPLSTFRRCVAAYDEEHKVKDFSCLDQFLTMAFAVCAYVLTAIVKKRLHLPQTLHEILQILSLNAFEKIPLHQLLTPTPDEPSEQNQLSLL